jgi:[ribosomal protein S5]-alanine N-acetyltransferase
MDLEGSITMYDLGTVLLETNRLILRPFCLTDAEDMHRNWASNPNVTKFLGWPLHDSPKDSEKIIADWIENYKDVRYYEWCIEYKGNHQAVGSIGVVNRNENTKSVEIGYCIGEDYWFQGITAEALREIVRFLFEEVGVNRIEARHDTKNPNSGKVMKKAGLRYEGTLIEAGFNNIGICDLSILGLTRRMYDASGMASVNRNY